MNAVRQQRNDEFIHGHIGWPALYSTLFHIAIFVLATVGLPHIIKDIEPTEMAVTVELVDLAEISQTNRVERPEKSEIEEAPAPPKPVYNNTETPPDLLSPQEPEVEDIPEPPTQEKPKPEPDERVIKNPPKPKNKPRRPKPTPPKPEEVKQEKPEEQKDFTSLLKSLTPDEPKETPTPKPETVEDNAGQTSQIADFSKELTRSELDDLNRGVEPCWNVNAGGKDAHNLRVDLRVFVNPDMRVREVQILDQLRYNTDSHFKAAAEAARRALLNPQCSTLRLPPEKYEKWKVFKYIFDPSQML